MGSGFKVLGYSIEGHFLTAHSAFEKQGLTIHGPRAKPEKTIPKWPNWAHVSLGETGLTL